MIISYGQDKFELTEEEFGKFTEALKKSSMIWIPRLNVFLTDKFIWAGKKPANPNRKLLNDGGYAVYHNFAWRPEKNLDAVLDLKYYPELLKDVDVETKQIGDAKN